MPESGHKRRSRRKPLPERLFADWKSWTTGLIAAMVVGMAGLGVSKLGAVQRALRRRIRVVQGEVEHLRATERAIARAFAGLRGDGEPGTHRRPMKKSVGRDVI